MESVFADVRGLVDQLNPLSRQNQILFFFWLFGYFYLMAGVWRCDRRGIRFSFLVIHQLFSAGVFISQVNILVLAIYLWIESLGIIVVATALAVFMFRRKKHKTPPDPVRREYDVESSPTPEAIEAQADQLTVAWRSQQRMPDEPKRQGV